MVRELLAIMASSVPPASKSDKAGSGAKEQEAPLSTTGLVQCPQEWSWCDEKMAEMLGAEGHSPMSNSAGGASMSKKARKRRAKKARHVLHAIRRAKSLLYEKI